MCANNRQYNGGTAVTLNFASASLVGVINPDDVSINSSGYSASVSNKHVGNGKSVSVTGVTIAGLQSGNYVLLSQPTGITVNITALPITITANSYSKVYGESDPPSFAYDASITLISGDTWAGAFRGRQVNRWGYNNAWERGINDGNGGIITLLIMEVPLQWGKGYNHYRTAKNQGVWRNRSGVDLPIGWYPRHWR